MAATAPATVWAHPEPATGSYFVSTYPPFSCWTPAETTSFRRSLERRPSAEPAPELGLYVHVPFCVERCAYCYYLTHDNRFADVSAYVDAVTGELSDYRRTPAIADRRPAFVYFGGGTPSVLPLGLLRRLVEGLQSAMPWDAAREVTFECAPRSATSDRVRFLREAGVTRLSLGVQSLDDEVLAAGGRVHLRQDVERAWDVISRASFPVVNLDLIAGLTGETDESFDRGLEQVMAWRPDSVTVYQLEIPHNTRLYRSLTQGGVADAPAGWEVKHARLALAFERLEAAGYHVRSGYAAVRDPDRHPFVYQDEQYRGADLLGIGVSAFSYLGGFNQQNVANLDGYLAARRRGDLPLWRAYELSLEERMIREFVLQLKLGRAERAYFRRKFAIDPGERFAEALAEGRRRGWFEVDEARVTVTRAGLVRIDRLLPAFYLVPNLTTSPTENLGLTSTMSAKLPK
jgi:oxygen-independent coproporphyrinogen-3 oxidase